MKTRVTYNGYAGMQVPTNVLKMANGAQLHSFSLQRKTAQDSATAMLSSQDLAAVVLAPTTNTDWYGELLRSQALITNHGIDLQGQASDKVTYSFGFNYTYQNGIMEARERF